MPHHIPYEIFLQIIEILAYEAEAACKELTFCLDYSDKTESHLVIQPYGDIKPLGKYGRQLNRYRLVHNILQIDSKTRAVVHSITNLRPFTMEFRDLADYGKTNEFNRIGWVSLTRDSFYLPPCCDPNLKDALRRPTPAASDLIGCLRRLKIDWVHSHGMDAVASLPNLEEFTVRFFRWNFDLDDVLSTWRYKYAGECRRIDRNVFPELAAWVDDYGSHVGLLEEKGVSFLVEDGDYADIIELFGTSEGICMKMRKIPGEVSIFPFWMCIYISLANWHVSFRIMALKLEFSAVVITSETAILPQRPLRKVTSRESVRTKRRKNSGMMEDSPKRTREEVKPGQDVTVPSRLCGYCQQS